MNYTLRYEQSLEQFHRLVAIIKLRLEVKYGPGIKAKWAKKESNDNQ